MASEKTRQKLIDVARQLFAKKGLEETTMNDIASASGKGRRTLYTYFKSKEAKQKASAAAEAKAPPAAAPASAAAQKLAPGSAGHVKLFDVPDKEAAMIMAIVADKMQKPLNELHFISIKEVK